MDQGPHHPTTATALIREFVAHSRELLMTEMRLARTELSDAASRAGTGAIYLAVALLFALVSFHALALTAILALAALGLPLVWAALITSVVVLILAGGCALAGSHYLKKSAEAPKRTIANLRNDLSSFEEATRV